MSSMSYGSSTSRKPWRWVRLGLIFTMKGIYINSNMNPLSKFTSSSRSTKCKENLSHLSNDHKDGPNQHKNSHELCKERSSHFWVWQKLKENWDNMIRISKWRESYCRTHTSIKREKEILKSRTVRVTLTNQGKKVTLLSKGIWDGKIIRVHLVYQFYQNRLASSYHGCQSIQSQKH